MTISVVDIATFGTVGNASFADVPLPADASVGNLIVIGILGPPHHFDQPWLTPTGWTFLQEVLHLGEFYKIANAADIAAGTVRIFVNPLITEVTEFSGASIALTGHSGSPIMGISGQPVCQTGTDAVCNGFHDEPPSNCFGPGCTVWQAPPINITEETTVLGIWSGHDNAYPLTVSSGWTQLTQFTSGREVNLYATKKFSVGSTGYQTVTPKAGANWDHAIATMIALNGVVSRLSGLLTLGGITLSDHNRDPLKIDYQLLMNEVRLASGKIRTFCIDGKFYKKTFTVSWKMLPGQDNQTYDGQLGRNNLKNLVYSDTREYEFSFTDIDDTRTYTVLIDDYKESLVKRFDDYYWDVTLTLAEK